ncbi:hypothetical protein [Rhodoplanes sp. SY1]|uniref:hypothetical protein n=1 Tax=Rhodoplanes sp. SY1 TaxID=3166646 RepID=UPI0038B66F7B
MNAIVPAAALAGAVPLAAAAAVPADPAAPEAAELVALGKRIGPALDAWRAAATAKTAARARAEALCPSVPADLVFDGSRPGPVRGLWRCWEGERDIEGRDLRNPTRGMYSAHLLSEGMAGGWLPSSLRSRAGRHVRRLFVLARQHEDARSYAIELSGLPVASAELQAATDVIKTLAEQASSIAPATAAGILVLARIARALSESASPELAGVVLGPALAEAVMRILGNPGEALS